MIHLKNEHELNSMVTGGKILADVLWEVLKEVQAGQTELAVDALAEKLIRKRGGKPGFQKVPGYKHTICVATNDVVVHGIPTTYVFKPGDVVCIDCGVYLDGLHTDMAETVIVGGEEVASPQVRRFLAIGKEALTEGIKQAVIGNRIGHISRAIQEIVEKKGGYSVVRSLIGHGVGRELHEAPEVPGYLDRPLGQTPPLKEGMTIAVEVLYNMGGPDVSYAGDDGWTIRSADGSLSAVFERSIAITKSGPLVLTA